MDRRSVDQKKACRKSLVVPHVEIASFLRLLDRPLQEDVGRLRPLVIRITFVIFVILQSSLDLRPDYPKPSLLVSPVGPGNQRYHEAA